MYKKTFAVSVLAVSVQYYDYHLLGFLAVNIAGYFFPPTDILTQLLSAYFLMFVAMTAKPLGALVLGKIGDLKGRSKSFALSLWVASLASFILFVAPSYASIGLFSLFILLVCRMLVCAVASAGSDGVRIFVFEHLESSRQCLGMGITTVFTLLGSLSASVVATVFSSSSMPYFGWKFTFLLGATFGWAVIIIMKLTGFKDRRETKTLPEFNKFKNESIYAIVKANRNLFILCTLLAGAIGSLNQFMIVFFGTYNFQVLKTVSQMQMQNYISISLIIYMIFSVIGGLIADRFSRYRTVLLGAGILLLIVLGQCYYLDKPVFKPALFFLMAAVLPFITMPAAVILTKSIPAAIRYRLFSLGHALGSIIISAPTAFISTFLYHKTGINWLPFCYFIVCVLVIVFVVYKLNARLLFSDENQNSV